MNSFFYVRNHLKYNTKYIEGLKIISNDYFQTKSTAYANTSNSKTAEVIE